MTAKKKKKGGGIFWKLLFLVALCVFCFSMYQLVNIYLGYKKGVDEYHAVAEATTVQSSEPLEVVEEKKDEEGNLIPEEELTVNPPEVDFDALKAINDDVVGWLELEAIPSISYPIAQGEDNEYYLHRTIKKTYNFAGSVFIDSTNASDFSDCNTIIYGHNMRSGAMFGTLKQYLDKDYLTAHKKISFDTIYEHGTYEVIDKLLKAHKAEEVAYRGCISLLKLADKYSGARVEKACKLALKHLSNPGYKNIKMILQSNQDLKDKNDNVQSECDMHAFVRGKDYYGGKNNG